MRQRQWARMVAAVLVLLLGTHVARGEIVTLTLESFAPATLPKVSTTIDLADPNDQLEVSRQAVLFALSPEGWDLGSAGGELHSLPTPEWTAWVWGIWNLLPTVDDQLAAKLGYELNAEAIANPGPNGPEYFLWFHTDAWAARGSHDVGERPNNYGQIAGCTGGTWFQSPVPLWGQFYVPEPATLALLALGGLVLLRRRSWRLRAVGMLGLVSVAIGLTADVSPAAEPNFAPAQNYAVGDRAIGIAAADLDGGGVLDLLITRWNTASISVFPGMPGGVFGQRSDYSVGSAPYFIATGDFNRDGKRDCAVSNMHSDSVTVLYGQGGGLLDSRQDHAVGSWPIGIAARRMSRS